MRKTSRGLPQKDPLIARRIEDCVEKIVKTFDTEKIILFGSFARGEVENVGTMDLLIIADTELSFFERIKKTLIACKGGFPSIEPLLYTRKEFDDLLEQGEGFLEDVIEEGIVVYEKKSK